jgi:hypothetical protein
VFVDNLNRLKNIFNSINSLPFLKILVHFDELSEEEIKLLNVPSTIELISFSSLLVKTFV